MCKEELKLEKRKAVGIIYFIGGLEHGMFSRTIATCLEESTRHI